jgi:hypothetical protein
MDDSQFNQTVERLREIDEVIKKLDPAIRADAFEMLKPFALGPPSSNKHPQQEAQQQRERRERDPQQASPAETSGAEKFVRSQKLDKPDQAVKAIAAWWYSQYGVAPFTQKDVKVIADEIGVTLPARPDMSIKRTKNADGKAVFRNAGKGKLVPTQPHGELFLQKEYGVTKGTKTPPSASADDS